MAELEALSNKELRQKCIEYGMPNVPVTDSSRKILIRRLEAVMSGKPIATTPAKNKRRETVHATKPTEVASSPKITINNNNNEAKPTPSNRTSRRTIAVPERHVTTTTTVSEPEYSDVSPDRVEPEPVRAKTKTPEKPPTLYPKLPAKEPSPKPQVLSKTGVVTTSYVTETNSVNKTYADADEIDLGEDFDIEEELVKKPVSNPTKYSYVPVTEPKANYVPVSQPKTSYVPLTQPKTSYKPVIEPKITTSAPVTASLSSSTRLSSLDSYDYKKPNYLSSTGVRSSYVPPATSYSRPSSQYARSYEAEQQQEYEDDDYEDDEDEVVLVEESPVKEIETPYLSQFARNLENIKATPIRHSVGPTKITPPKSMVRNRDTYTRRTTLGSTSAYVNARPPIKTNRQDDSPFRQFMLAMEEKYHLKHTLLLISIFILIVFIYVFFIQSV